MTASIRRNQIAPISAYFDNIVPLSINGISSNYTPNQAAVVLHNFFDHNSPVNFAFTDSSRPQNNTRFVNGRFSCSTGSYKIAILLLLRGDAYIVKKIRIARE